jgi:hypothetical protein
MALEAIGKHLRYQACPPLHGLAKGMPVHPRAFSEMNTPGQLNRAADRFAEIR